MSVLSRYLARDALAAAFVVGVMAVPAEAASRSPPSAKPAKVAAMTVPPVRDVVPSSAQERLLAARATYDGLARSSGLLRKGTEVCLKDMRWFLMKVRDEDVERDTVPASYVRDASERYGRAVETRKAELVSSAMPGVDLRQVSSTPSERAVRASEADVVRLRESAERLHGVRTSCVRWAERATASVAAAAGAPEGSRLTRLREARAAAERDYLIMQSVDADSAVEVLDSMELGAVRSGPQV